MVDIKLFDAWNVVKKLLQQRAYAQYFREGQIWWCSIGQNVGSETYGKGNAFVRPFLIFKKYSHNMFFGIPLTSKAKTGDWYSGITFKGKRQVVMLHQARMIDSKRLSNRIGEVPEKELIKIADDLANLWYGEKYSPHLTVGIDGLPQK